MADKKQHGAKETETEEVQPDWEKLLRWLGPVTALILVATTVFMWTQNKDETLRLEVSQAYRLAGSAEELDAIAEAYPKQPEAPLALLQSASASFNNDRDFDGALEKFSRFLEAYEDHPQADNARWGVWMSREAKGELDEALKGYTTLGENDLLYPQALFARARIHEKKGQKEEAVALYLDIQKRYAETGWAEQAKKYEQIVRLSI